MSNKCPKCNHENFSASEFCKNCGAKLVPSEEIPIHTQTLQTPTRGAIKDVDVGEIIDKKYKLIEELGSGGMGVVYMAEQKEPVKRNVALKIIKLGMDTQEVVARFDMEKQALAVMTHPNIAKVYDAGATKSGRPYFVMELVSGSPITDYCDKHKLSIKERLELFIPVCEAVQHAHQKGVIHRDLKPSNVLVEVQGDKPTPKVIDFGIAKATGHRLAERTLFTERGQLIGTPEYMSPEQAEISGLDVDTRTDIYSLGMMLYELLVGVLPFDPKALRSAGFAEIQRIIREEEPPRASTRFSNLGDTQTSIVEQRKTDVASLHKQLKGDLEWITMKAMEKDRTRRYASANELATEIQRYLNLQPVLAGPPSGLYRLRKFVRRHKVVVGFASVLFTFIVAFAIIAALQSARIARERDRALTAEKLTKEQRDRAIEAEQIEANQRKIAEEARIGEQKQRLIAETNVKRALEAEKRAADEAKRAKNEAERAQKEADTANQVTNLIANLFASADPNKSRGETITVREVLDKSAEQVPKTLMNKPLVKYRLMRTIASIYDELGMTDKASNMLEAALKVYTQNVSANDTTAAGETKYLGRILRNKGDFARAEELDRKALGILRNLPKTESNVSEMIGTMNELASLLADGKGQYEEAEKLMREAHEIYRNFYGKSVGEEYLNDLAGVLEKKGDYEGAQKLLQEALTKYKEKYGEQHSYTAVAINNLAMVLRDKGDYTTAESNIRKALAICQKVYKEHWITAVMMDNLAQVLRDKGEYEEAENLYQNALGMYRKQLKESLYIGNTLSHLSSLMLDKKEYNAAEEFCQQALTMRKKLLDAHHPSIARSLILMGVIQTAMGNAKDAEPMIREGIEVLKSKFHKNHWEIAYAESSLGYCLTALRKFEEAEPLLVENYKIIKSNRGEKHKLTLEVIERIVKLYQSWGKPDKAKEYEAKLKK
jgi:serine/threonine protein kinase/tetratricopeptide (TPR) repeat protein